MWVRLIDTLFHSNHHHRLFDISKERSLLFPLSFIIIILHRHDTTIVRPRDCLKATQSNCVSRIYFTAVISIKSLFNPIFTANNSYLLHQFNLITEALSSLMAWRNQPFNITFMCGVSYISGLLYRWINLVNAINGGYLSSASINISHFLFNGDSAIHIFRLKLVKPFNKHDDYL